MKDKTPFRRFVDRQNEIGNSKAKLAKLWGVTKATVHNMYNAGAPLKYDIFRTICEKSNVDPRVLMGWPDVAICPRCHRETHVEQLRYSGRKWKDEI